MAPTSNLAPALVATVSLHSRPYLAVAYHNLTDLAGQLLHSKPGARANDDNRVRPRLDAAGHVDSSPDLPPGTVSHDGSADLAGHDQAVPARAVICALCGVD